MLRAPEFEGDKLCATDLGKHATISGIILPVAALHVRVMPPGEPSTDLDLARILSGDTGPLANARGV